MRNEQTVFACNPAAMDKEQRARYAILTKQLFAAGRDVRELPDGYAVGFSANLQTIKDAAEFISYERLCCPFLNKDTSTRLMTWNCRRLLIKDIQQLENLDKSLLTMLDGRTYAPDK